MLPFLLLKACVPGEEVTVAEGEPVFAIEMAEGFAGELDPGRRASSTTRRARTVPATTQIQGERDVFSVSRWFWLMQITFSRIDTGKRIFVCTLRVP